MFRATGQHYGIEFTPQMFDFNVLAYFRVGNELDALGGHLLEPAIDDVLLHFELGNAVTQQSADAVGLLVDRDRMSGAAQLLGRSQSRRTRTDDRYFFSTANLRGFRTDPTLEKAALHNIFLVLLDRDWRLVDAQYARCLARSGTDAAGKLGKVIGRVQLSNSFLPASAINQIVPVGDKIADGTSR